MNPSSLFRAGSLLAFAGIAACADIAPDRLAAPLSPSEPSLNRTFVSDDAETVSSIFDQVNADLAASGSNRRAVRAELMLDGNGWDGATSAIIIADHRSRGIGSEWVKGDPRRDGRIGVTYAVGSNTSAATPPFTRDAGSTVVRPTTAAEQDAYIEEGMTAWRNVGCSAKAIARVPVPAGTDPDYLDQFFRGVPAGSANYAQPADIVQSGWQPSSWFRTLAGGVAGNSIIGVTFTFVYVNGAGARTDIDGNGRFDLALAEIYYNQRFLWNNGTGGGVDFFSIITHETGHALGLGHFGKVFVTKRDGADGLQIADLKYAPYAMMNAVYVTGRNELAGADRSVFCALWAGN